MGSIPASSDTVQPEGRQKSSVDNNVHINEAIRLQTLKQKNCTVEQILCLDDAGRRQSEHKGPDGREAEETEAGRFTRSCPLKPPLQLPEVLATAASTSAVKHVTAAPAPVT
jgi:hypothetical protein